jgi:hypothetical protein
MEEKRENGGKSIAVDDKKLRKLGKTGSGHDASTMVQVDGR